MKHFSPKGIWFWTFMSLYCLSLLKISSTCCLGGWKQLILNILLYNLPEKLEEPVKLLYLLCIITKHLNKKHRTCCLLSQPCITICSNDDVSIMIHSQCNVLPKPQWSRLIPSSFLYFHRHKPHREGQGNLESDP